ncbi:MAG: glyoxylate/hydroxypyruvate reductase A [Pseudomonadota bacterium]|nr:glyoxylate/hydroxypyruvate reductase A [Pseudomonadota bacterium]
MTPNIFFHSHLDSSEQWRKALAEHFEDLRFSTAADLGNPDEVDIAIVWTLPEGGLERFVNLRAILSLGAGINQLDPSRLPPRVPLARLVDPSLTRTMVDYAKTAVYRYHRRFHEFERLSRRSEWKYIPPTLTRSTSIGLLGLGELGRAIAGALRAEGFDVRGWSRTPKHLDDIQTYTGGGGLAAMLAVSDIVINVLPLTDDTRHILCRELFSHFRKGACLINMGRGLHLVEADLLQAIDDDIIADATLDVATVEPIPLAHPFWDHPRILVTPHVAGFCMPDTASKAVADNIRRAMAGEPLLNQVDLTRGY